MKKIVLIMLFLGNLMYVTAQKSSNSYQIKFLEINKQNSDYAVAMIDNDKLVFTSAANEKNSNNSKRNPRKELFIGDIDFDGEILNIKPVTNKENNKFNTSGIAYTNNLKTVYFSRNKYVRKLSKQNLAKNKRLELYKAKVDDEGNWIDIEKLSINDDNYSTGYPSLSKDNSKLYFVSDRLPSMGKTDIFVVDIYKDGTLGNPRNLGNKINTPGNETTPFITDDNILYFASDGHKGEGNLDIYAADLSKDSSEIRHLEAPINSINDDFAYIINQETNRGFFTSNRLQGKANYDLYSFTLKKEKTAEDCFITVDGFVKDKESQELLKGTTVDLLDLKGALIQSVVTADDGSYLFNVGCNKEYKLSAINSEYKKEEKLIEILDHNYHRSLHTNMNLTKLFTENANNSSIKADNTKITSINAIHFDFDKANLRQTDLPELDKIVKIMKDNTNIKVEAHAYTDSRGTHAYNKLLSQRRANATVNYIISKGIDPQRIKGVGFGEEKLVNQCVDGVECSEEQHEMNRRTEFVILNKVAVNEKIDNSSINSNQPITADKKEEELVTKSINQHKVSTENNSQKSNVSSTISTSAISNNKPEEIKNDLAIQSKKNDITENDIIENENKEIALSKNELADKKAELERNKFDERPRTDNKAENYLDDQKDKVLDKLIVLEDKFDKAASKNTNLKKSFEAEKEKIVKLKKEVLKSNEVGWANIINYNNQIISFNKRYKQLIKNIEENQETSDIDNNEIKQSQKNIEKTNSVSANHKNKIEDNNLDIKNVQIIAMKRNDKGKFAITNSAKKTDIIKVSFKVVHNKKVEPGKKEAHIVLQNPEGKVTNAKGVFTIKTNNEKKKFTDSTVIDYDNQDVDIVMFINRNGYEYKKGTYPVKFFLEGELVAVSKLDLKSSF